MSRVHSAAIIISLSAIILISLIWSPAPVFADTMGNTSSAGMSVLTNGTPYLLLARFIAATTGTLSSITLFVPNPSGQGNVGIYSDSSNKPGSLLGQSTPQTLSASPVTFPISGSITITSGIAYWLAFQTTAGQYYAGGTGTRGWASNTCCTLPSSVSGFGSTSGSDAIYATYSATTTTSSTTTPGPVSFNVHAGTTQVIVTVGWTGSGTVSVSISGPGGSPTLTEASGTIYDRYTYAAGSGTPTNIHRVTFSITAPGSAQTWTVTVTGVTGYSLTVEVS